MAKRFVLSDDSLNNVLVESSLGGKMPKTGYNFGDTCFLAENVAIIKRINFLEL